MHDFKYQRLVLFLIFVSFFFLYVLIITFVRYQDMWDHACFARQMLTGERPTSGNFLFYWLINIFSFFSTNKIPSKISLCFLLAIATTFRYYLVQKELISIPSRNITKVKKVIFSNILALSLLFVFVIPIPSYFINGNFYIGNFAPNVWHNSTTIFLFPFAFLLFSLSYKQLEEVDKRRNLWIILLIFINIFIKPSYFFVFFFVYPLFLFNKYKFNKDFWKCLFPVILGLIFLFIEYWSIYQTTIPDSKEASSVILKPSYSNELLTGYGPLSLLFSLFFPITYFLLNISELKGNKLFWYTTFSFVFSILIFAFIGESGPRATHGNFYWQVVICSWFCFFVSLRSLFKNLNLKSKRRKNILLMSIYFSHVLIGVIYVVRLFIVDNYY